MLFLRLLLVVLGILQNVLLLRDHPLLLVLRVLALPRRLIQLLRQNLELALLAVPHLVLVLGLLLVGL